MEYRPLEGFVLAVSPVQLHRDRRQPPRERGADGQHRRLEARQHGRLLGPLPDAAPPGSRASRPGVINLVYGPGRDDRRRGAREPRSRGRALHGLDRRLQLDVEHDRLQHRRVPQLPADRRRDGRQGLHRRAPLRGRGRGRDGDRPRLLRVPGPEVLGRVPRLRAGQPLAGAARAARRGGRPDQDGRRRRLRELHGRGHRRELAEDPAGGDRGGPRTSRPRCWSAAASATTRATSSSRP